MAEINKTPLKLKDIPTNNQIRIIDNYSPSFNYIIEDDKVYYSQKGRDHWVDISENTYARTNLLKFLNDNYSFRGYDDREKEIYNLIQEGKYDWKTFGQQNKQEKPPLPTRKVVPKETQKEVPVKKTTTRGPTYFTTTPGIVVDPQAMYNASKAISKALSGFFSKETFKVDNPGDAGTVWNNVVEGNFGDAADMVRNGISRQWDKRFGADNDPVSDFKIPGSSDTTTKYAIRPQSFTGDTIRTFNQRVSNQQYIIPEAIDVNEYTFGYRNRGQNSPINTEAALITAFRNFKPYGQHDKGYQTYIGIDKDGKLKAGGPQDFEEGDMLTGTYSNDIASFRKDGNGNIIMTNSTKNPAQNQPTYILWDNGNLVEKPSGQAINILVRKDDPVGNQYGNVTGGRVLVRVGNELRLLSGSVKDIDRQFEAMKKRNNAQYGTFYTLDNGSFNRGLRTFNQRLTTQDLKRYDNLNAGGGNFLYLKERLQPRQVFRSDTIWTPNVRTVNDESYKKGHGLVNEQKGITLHHTAFMDNDLTSVIKHLTRPNGESAHVIIGYDGTRKVLARPNQVTFHAGQSAWNNRTNVNDFMVGIEFQGDTNKKDLTEQQIESAVEYMTPIIRQNNIRLEDIVTHEQVRNLYNDYAKKNNQRTAPSKPDINQVNYKRILDRLKQKVYYEK